jgi:hypothetical protein
MVEKSIARAKEFLLSGMSNKEIYKQLKVEGLAAATVKVRLADIRKEVSIPPCHCGRPPGHRGDCKVRLWLRRERIGIDE